MSIARCAAMRCTGLAHVTTATHVSIKTLIFRAWPVAFFLRIPQQSNPAETRK